MRYSHVKSGVFLDRPNRFIALVQTEDGLERCHVKNTGRCKELLIPGTPVWLAISNNKNRKTACDLICVKKGNEWVNLDSQAPNFAAGEYLPRLYPELTLLRPETVFEDSRLDFYWEGNGSSGFVEVKGVTLEEDGVARFPDAPTLRGIKHLQALMRAKEQGYRAAVLFVIQMAGVHGFAPNDRTHPAFGDALRLALQAGVEIYAVDCTVTPDSMVCRNRITVWPDGVPACNADGARMIK